VLGGGGGQPRPAAGGARPPPRDGGDARPVSGRRGHRVPRDPEGAGGCGQELPPTAGGAWGEGVGGGEWVCGDGCGEWGVESGEWGVESGE